MSFMYARRSTQFSGFTPFDDRFSEFVGSCEEDAGLTHSRSVCEDILAIADYAVERRLYHACEGRGPGNDRSFLDLRLRGNDKECCH